jgi:hypothetical protein
LVGIVTASVVTAASAGPAFASKESVNPGSGISTWLAILLYVGVPLAVFFVIAAFVWGPDLARRPRYRPGSRAWGWAPVWIGGPEEPEATLTRTPPEAVREARGGGAGAGW